MLNEMRDTLVFAIIPSLPLHSRWKYLATKILDDTNQNYASVKKVKTLFSLQEELAHGNLILKIETTIATK